MAEKVKWEELVELIRATPAPEEAPSVPDDSLKLPDDDAGNVFRRHNVNVLLLFVD